jgi:ketosteroid isomerase-like protein
MSQENIEVVRWGFESISEGDVDGILRLMDPGIERCPKTI